LLKTPGNIKGKSDADRKELVKIGEEEKHKRDKKIRNTTFFEKKVGKSVKKGKDGDKKEERAGTTGKGGKLQKEKVTFRRGKTN